MINKIAHRILDFEKLCNLPDNIGIEFDVHAYGRELVIAHDAFNNGLNFSEFISKVGDRFMAVNIKEEGIEEKVFEILLDADYKKFFLFDVSVPQIFRLGKKYSSNLAFRYSQLENINLDICKNYANYLWIDTFDGSFWPSRELIEKLKRLSFKLCFVSPELHNPTLGNSKLFSQKLLEFRNLLGEEDHLCTKIY